MSNMYFQCLLGIQTREFAIIAVDQTNIQNILIIKNDENKVHQITDKLLMGVIGDCGDIVQFGQFVAKNLQLYKMRNNYQLGIAAAVHFTRKRIIETLRTDSRYIVNLLMAGYDDAEGAQLYYLDYLGSCVKVPFAVHGYGGVLSLSILDRYYKPTLSEKEAYDVMKLCIEEVHHRLFINLPNFQVSVVDKSGVKEMPMIDTSTITTKTIVKPFTLM